MSSVLYMFVAEGQGIRILLARPVLDDVGGDPWGRLAPLREDPAWRNLIPEVSAEALSHALHGYVLPLLRESVREPLSSLRAAQKSWPHAGACQERNACAAYAPATCRPLGRPPACYVPPSLPAGAAAAREVVHAWASGHRVLVPVGKEFVLRG